MLFVYSRVSWNFYYFSSAFYRIFGFFSINFKVFSFSSSFLYNDGFKALSWTLLLFLVIISQKFMFFFHHFQSFTLSRHHFCTMMVSKHKKTWCISIVIIVKWCYFIVIIVKRCFKTIIFNDGFKALDEMMLFYSDISQMMFLNHHVQWWFQSIRSHDAIF